MKSYRTNAGPKIEFSVLLVKRPGTMKRPMKPEVERLLQAVWNAQPVRRKPKWNGNHRVAADVIVVGDGEIAELNQRHMQHEGATDVLSFPMLEYDHERDAFMLGEVVVSSETAQREAKERKLESAEELSRYIVHGFLHLLGYDDQTEDQAREMEALQERILSGLK